SCPVPAAAEVTRGRTPLLRRNRFVAERVSTPTSRPRSSHQIGGDMTTFAPINRISAVIAIAVATAAATASTASAAGEPKNQMPFTRTVGARALTHQLVSARGAVHIVLIGVPKIEVPFL